MHKHDNDYRNISAHTRHTHRGSDGTKQISRAQRGYSYKLDFPKPFSARNHLGFLAKETICYFTINMLNVPNVTTKYHQLVCIILQEQRMVQRLWAIISPSEHRKYPLYNKMIYSVNANIRWNISHKIWISICLEETRQWDPNCTGKEYVKPETWLNLLDLFTTWCFESTPGGIFCLKSWRSGQKNQLEFRFQWQKFDSFEPVTLISCFHIVLNKNSHFMVNYLTRLCWELYRNMGWASKL